MDLKPHHQVACLILAMDRELASKVLRSMRREDVHTITLAMKELEEITLDEKSVNEVLRETVERMRRGGVALGDVGPAIADLMINAFGENDGREVVERVEKETLAKWPFARFEAMKATDLMALLEGEHVQVVAVFLAHLDPIRSGEVLSLMPEEVRPELIKRIAALDRTPPEVLQRVIEVLRSKVKNMGVAAGVEASDPKQWIQKAAQILNNVEGAVEKEILGVVGENDKEVAETIREEMFTFDDLADLDKKSMQKVLGGIDTKVLSLALKACSPGAEENIFNNLSKRAGAMVEEERDTLGPTPLPEVLEAQKEVMTVIRQMIETGEIKVARGGSTELV